MAAFRSIRTPVWTLTARFGHSQLDPTILRQHHLESLIPALQLMSKLIPHIIKLGNTR